MSWISECKYKKSRHCLLRNIDSDIICHECNKREINQTLKCGGHVLCYENYKKINPDELTFPEGILFLCFDCAKSFSMKSKSETSESHQVHLSPGLNEVSSDELTTCNISPLDMHISSSHVSSVPATVLANVSDTGNTSGHVAGEHVPDDKNIETPSIISSSVSEDSSPPSQSDETVPTSQILPSQGSEEVVNPNLAGKESGSEAPTSTSGPVAGEHVPDDKNIETTSIISSPVSEESSPPSQSDETVPTSQILPSQGSEEVVSKSTNLDVKKAVTDREGDTLFYTSQDPSAIVEDTTHNQHQSQEQVCTSIVLDKIGKSFQQPCFNLTISPEYLQQLIDGDKLNDELINFYCGKLVETKTDGTVQMCSTFLASQFMSAKSLEEKVKNMKKFCKITDRTSMFIPFHLNQTHWTLGYVNFQTKVIEYYDHCFGDYNPDGFQPLTVLREMCASLQISTEGWTESVKTSDEIDRQEGNKDCGVHVCMDILQLLQVDKVFEVKNFPVHDFRVRMSKEISDWLEGIQLHTETRKFDTLSESKQEERRTYNHPFCDLRSLPNVGNTCHFTAACWCLCSHLNLDSVMDLLQSSNDNPEFVVQRSLLRVLVHLMANPDSTSCDTLEEDILTVMNDIYPGNASEQQDVGETFTNLMELLTLNRALPERVLLSKTYTCDLHSESSRVVIEEFPSMTLYLPENTNSMDFATLVDMQQSGGSTEWKCPAHSKSTECKSSTFQIIVGPPPNVVTFYIERHLSNNRFNVANVVVNRIFNLVVHNPVGDEVRSEERYDRQTCLYRVVSASFHTYNADMEREVTENQKNYIPNPRNGHYLVCKEKMWTSREKRQGFVLCDDLKYPLLQSVSDEYILEHGKNVVLVTAVLASTNTLVSDSDESESHSEDDDSSDEESTDGERISEKKSSKNIHYQRLKRFKVQATNLMQVEVGILLRQLKHFVATNVERVANIPGLFTETNSYSNRIDQFNENPSQFIDRFGIHALRLLWNLPQINVYSLGAGESIDLDVQDPEDKSEFTTRALLRTCISPPNSCVCMSGLSACEFVYYPLYSVELFPEGKEGFTSLFGKMQWDTEAYTELVHGKTIYLVGPSIDSTHFICPSSSFLAAVTNQEIVYNGLFVNQVSKLWSSREKVNGFTFEPLGVKFPENKVPADLNTLRLVWKSLESEASRLNRAASTTTVVETDISTVWKIFATIMSVLPVEGRSSMVFVDLTNGRRGALLANMMLRIPCIGVEKNQNVFNESVKLVNQAAVSTKTNNQVFMVNANYSTISSFEGVLGCCMYIGNDPSIVTEDYEATIPRIFSAESMMFFYDCKTNEKLFREFVIDPTVSKKWYMTRVPNCRQETNSHMTYLWMKKMKYWDEAGSRPSKTVKDWLHQIKKGIVSNSPMPVVTDVGLLSQGQPTNPRSLYFSPPPGPRRNSARISVTKAVTPPVTAALPATQTVPSKKRKNPKKKTKKKGDKSASKNQFATPQPRTPSSSSQPRTPASTTKTRTTSNTSQPKTPASNKQTGRKNQQSSPEEDIYSRITCDDMELEQTPQRPLVSPLVRAVPGSSTLADKDPSTQSPTKLPFYFPKLSEVEKCVDSAISKHLGTSGQLGDLLAQQSKVLGDAVRKQITDEAQKQENNLVMKRVDDSATRTESKLQDSMREIKEFIEKSDLIKQSGFYKSAFETIASVAGTRYQFKDSHGNIDCQQRVQSRSRSRKKVSRSLSRGRERLHKRHKQGSRSRSRSPRRTKRKSRSSSRTYSRSTSRRQSRSTCRTYSRSMSRRKSRSRSQKRGGERRREALNRKSSSRSRSRSRQIVLRDGSSSRYRSRSGSMYQGSSSYSSSNRQQSGQIKAVHVTEWSSLQVSQYLSSKNFSSQVCSAFQSAQIHGRVLKEANAEYIGTRIRVQNNIELFNENQIPSLVEVIQEVLKLERR